MKKSLINIILLLLILINLSYNLKASHLMAGEIITEPVYEEGVCNPLKVTVHVIAYINSRSTVPFGGGSLHFGDGNSLQIPEQTSTPGSLDPNIQVAKFTITHEYRSYGSYLITYSDANRNGGIRNLSNSVSIKFYLESRITLEDQIICNTSPVLTIPPVDKACAELKYFHHPGAFDADGDSISFELVKPKSGENDIANGYQDPASGSFYSDFENGNEAKDAPPIFQIDPITGLITWDAPPASNNETESYTVAFKVKEWRKINGEWRLIGFIVRDMQIIVVSNCINKPPEIESFDRICVIAGEIIDEDILALDPDNDSISISVFSEVFSTKSSPATLDTISSKSLKFSWQTDCSHVRSTEYQVVFRVTDFPDDGQVSLTRYFTLRIKVIGPPPEILDITKEETALNLTWSPYTCQNASAIEIWRRVDSNNFLLENCATGMPTYSGYERIATVLASDQSFSDNDLIMGAKYCYRLLAIYDNINITESKVSEETCYEFIPAEAPVITNVSVKRTHYSLGEIDIRWMKPFDLDFTVFTGDIVYELYRSKNDESSFEFVKRLTNDTSFLDGGLNTADSIYYYRLLLKVPEILGEEVVDTSATASTVRLTASGAENKVDLAWGADVPWSNYIKDGYHLIYRTEGEAEFIEALDLIDSVRVTEDGFNYEDIGEYLNTPIDNTKTYCYAVMTRGTYGNPKIQSPLENFSQIHCIQPVDSIPPDAPVFVNSGTKCEDIGCTEFEFKNQLYWNNIESGVTYNIYYAPSTADSFLYLTTTKDTFYTDTPDNNARMISFAGCYKIEAIDRAGNVSGLSDVFCFDNCPRYELPNVFTPENNDQCNDLFTAFKVPEGNDIKCGVVDGSRCARFVKSVKFIVYNRWGKQVYNYESDPEKSIYINWNGMDSYAKPLPAGVYYYVAKVIFDVVNPDEAEQDIKGWVHILR